MENNCDFILETIYTKKLVDELQLSMCTFINLNNKKSIGLFISDHPHQKSELLVSYDKGITNSIPELFIHETLILSYYNAKKEQFYHWKGTLSTIRSMVKLLDFYCETELKQKPMSLITDNPFILEFMQQLVELEKRNLQIESKLRTGT